MTIQNASMLLYVPLTKKSKIIYACYTLVKERKSKCFDYICIGFETWLFSINDICQKFDTYRLHSLFVESFNFSGPSSRS